MQKITALGLMSGSSLDGLDLALCSFWEVDNKWRYEILATEHEPYTEDFKSQLALAGSRSAIELLRLDRTFALLMADAVNRFMQKYDCHPDLLASHGHTVFHQPEEGLTLQIGCGAVLAAKCNITTICDFRTTDIALGGQGAPLVPVGDKLLFNHYDACLNLGGISNISFQEDGKLTAFDISLCNMPLNALAFQLGKAYDEIGAAAKQGRLYLPLFEQLNALPYFTQKGAKSLSREWYEQFFLPLLKKQDISVYDQLRTVTEHIACQIAKHIPANANLLVTGGGAKNSFLIELLQSQTTAKIILPDEKLIDFKEAVLFAFLGVLRFLERENCLNEVTGATRNCSSGCVYFASR